MIYIGNQKKKKGNRKIKDVLRLLHIYLCPPLNVKSKCFSAFEAKDWIEKQKERKIKYFKTLFSLILLLVIHIRFLQGSSVRIQA